MKNLNELVVSSDSGEEDYSLRDFSTSTRNKRVQVYFRNLESHLVRHVESADIVLGCVAWLTSEPILNALAKKEGVSIVVQKEDFLRPDIMVENGSDSWKRKLRKLYGRLPSTLGRFDAGFGGTILPRLSIMGDQSIEAIRCVGSHNSDKHPAFPRAHHKFVVLCKRAEPIVYDEDYQEGGNFKPYAVWTGSYNFTQNATRSLENAVVLSDPDIVNSFFMEYAQIAALSEPLDWRSRWVAPEWRIGT